MTCAYLLVRALVDCHDNLVKQLHIQRLVEVQQRLHGEHKERRRESKRGSEANVLDATRGRKERMMNLRCFGAVNSAEDPKRAGRLCTVRFHARRNRSLLYDLGVKRVISLISSLSFSFHGRVQRRARPVCRAISHWCAVLPLRVTVTLLRRLPQRCPPLPQETSLCTRPVRISLREDGTASFLSFREVL